MSPPAQKIPVRKKLLWRLFLSYLVITFLSLYAAAWFASGYLKNVYLDQTRDNLKIRAQLFERLIPSDLSDVNTDEIDRLCSEIGPVISTRITVILPGGLVIGDSDKNHEEMDNHKNRPEIVEAFRGNDGMSVRYSDTLEKELMYVALPVIRDGSTICVVRTSMPVATIDSAVNEIKYKIAVIIGIIALAAAVVSFIVSRWIDRPVKGMMHGVERFASGDLEYRIPVTSSDELGLLALSINDMAAQLYERVRTVTEQRSELEAILSGMVEAILVVDNDGRIREHNQAAGKYFDHLDQVRGKRVEDVIGNTRLFDFIKQTISQTGFIEDEIVLHRDPASILQAHGTQFLDAGGRSMGAIVVLNDITRIKKLENMRREFVANVSHELKTPITSIIGFVETLNDGAIEDVDNRQQFLDIILKHARRLNAIIEDLLSISRLEQESMENRIVLEENTLCAILRNAVTLCETEANNKNIALDLGCDKTITVRSNAPLLEQAVVNLIDNAVKYSEPDSSIHVKAFRSNKEIAIEVKDYGCGIPEESLTRIFERFYRVDKGRSRARGGTGLGLSIVKHIVNAHSGRIDVVSVPDEGSTFTIFLPAH